MLIIEPKERIGVHASLPGGDRGLGSVPGCLHRVGRLCQYRSRRPCEGRTLKQNDGADGTERPVHWMRIRPLKSGEWKK